MLNEHKSSFSVRGREALNEDKFTCRSQGTEALNEEKTTWSVMAGA